MDNTVSVSWPNVAVREIGGVPTFCRDDQPWFAWGAQRPYHPERTAVFERLTAQGLGHCHLDATSTEDIYHPEIRFWIGPGQYDGTAQEHYIRRILKICPDALIMLRVYVGAPSWWLAQHPEECQVFADGHVEHEIRTVGPRLLPSPASQAWRAAACDGLRRYVDWLKSTGLSRHVMAILLTGGITWEWGLLGSEDFLDYSDHAVNYFRRWLRQRYPENGALARAWGVDVALEEAEVPSAERRTIPHGPAGYRETPAEQDVIDFQQCLSDMNVDLILSLAETARRATDGKIPVGAFYGYTLTAREHSLFMGTHGAGGFQGGHHALGRVLRSPHIDFLASPFNYANRDLGTGYLMSHCPLRSVHAHGKAFFDENDNRGHLPTSEGLPPGFSIGLTQTPEESLLLLRLSFAQAVVRGKHQWLTEMPWGWDGEENGYAHPEVSTEIGRLNAMADELLTRDRSPVTEMAFIVDERSVAFLGLDHAEFCERLYRGHVLWGHLGAPYDLLLLEDLVEGRAGGYRLVIPACVKDPDSVKRMKRWQAEQPDTFVWWDRDRSWYPPLERDLYLERMDAAGVHRYVQDASVVLANRAMVCVHVDQPGTREIDFGGSFAGREIFSGRGCEARTGSLPWEFARHGVALFVSDALQQPTDISNRHQLAFAQRI